MKHWKADEKERTRRAKKNEREEEDREQKGGIDTDEGRKGKRDLNKRRG